MVTKLEKPQHVESDQIRRRKTFRYADSSSDKCRWYKVPYPVTTTCRCACQ